MQQNKNKRKLIPGKIHIKEEGLTSAKGKQLEENPKITRDSKDRETSKRPPRITIVTLQRTNLDLIPQKQRTTYKKGFHI